MMGLDTMLHGSCLASGVSYRPCMYGNAHSYNSPFLCISSPPSRVAVSSIRGPLKSCSYRGVSSATSRPLHMRNEAYSFAELKLPREPHFHLSSIRAFNDVTYDAPSLYSSKLPFLCATTLRSPRQEQFSLTTRAFKDASYLKMDEKPKWWWRTLACLPYLMPLHLTWYFAGESFHLRPLVEKSNFLSNPYNNFLRRLPTWLMMAYTFTACFYVVRKKEWPHFFRFHVIMAILLENWMHIIIVVYGWLPPFVHWGNNIGTHIWAAVTVGFLMMILQCLKCTLSGKYVDIPLASDAADFHLKGLY